MSTHDKAFVKLLINLLQNGMSVVQDETLHSLLYAWIQELKKLGE